MITKAVDMLAQLLKNRLPKFVVLGLTASILFFSCSKPSKVEPEVVVPAEYELKDVRYFMDAGDHLDTVTVKLKGVTLRNSASVVAVQQVEDDFAELVKTSQFEVNKSTLPEDVQLAQLEVKVPERWYGKDSHSYFPETFTLSPEEQQKPYGAYQKDVMKINIPPKSTIVVDRQINAYHLACSFDGILVNKSTGQRYSMKGKWKGVLFYNNASVNLQQYPLAQ
ncbi:hypothetical protein GCM10027347_12890 [Larkinella harenae]